MAELALKAIIESGKNVEERIDDRDISDKIRDTHTEELIIGLCGPIGTDIHFVAEEIKQVIEEKYDYEVIIIRLSQFIKDKSPGLAANFPDKFSEIQEMIDAGNKLRDVKGHSVLAELAISKIAVVRETKHRDSSFKSHRTCYIIDSIKNTEELATFRLIYSSIFYFIGVFSNLKIREQHLEKIGVSKYDLLKLIDRDSGEEIKNGQKVSDTFMQADFFLRNDNLTSAAIKFKIERYLNLIFATEIITPSPDETAMYQAFAAAGNSACLSRQVGASITNQNGDIISLGWNDVPKYGGGVYTYSQKDLLGQEDKRCLNLERGICFNDDEKTVIRNLLIADLITGGVVEEKNRFLAETIIKKSRIKELIEFSRAVHAEMLAIISSQISGKSIVGGKLYCTTYPCHNCARHIVAAGITDVYYIEPYRKSLAIKLHEDSISENENDEGKKLRVLMFDGIAPRRYLEFFKMEPNSRKENGRKRMPEKKTVSPKNTVSLQAIPILEKQVIQDLKNKQLIEVPNEG